MSKDFYRISSEVDGVRHIDENGTEHTVQPEPFQPILIALARRYENQNKGRKTE